MCGTVYEVDRLTMRTRDELYHQFRTSKCKGVGPGEQEKNQE